VRGYRTTPLHPITLAPLLLRHPSGPPAYLWAIMSSSLHLPLLIETDEDGVFIVSCPAFKGCHSYGKTVDEAIANIREVIAMCLEER
jgi:hypothetical protein